MYGGIEVTTTNVTNGAEQSEVKFLGINYGGQRTGMAIIGGEGSLWSGDAIKIKAKYNGLHVVGAVLGTDAGPLTLAVVDHLATTNIKISDKIEVNGSVDILNVIGSTGNAFVRFTDSDATADFSIGADDGSGAGAGAFILYDRTTSAYRLVVNSSGNVGIGTTTPTGGLEIQGPHIGVDGVDDDYYKALKLSIPDNTEWGGQAQFSVGRWQNSGNHARSSLVIALGHGTQNSDSDADTRVMTLISSGRVIFSPTGTPDGQGVTTYANGANGHYVSCTGTSNYWITNHGQSSSTGTLSTFYNNGTYCGGINISSTNVTSYVSASDYRLKENVVPMTGATERLKQLNPVTFDWINSGEASEGFIAHEVGAVVPISTTGTKDEVYDQAGSDDNPNINEGDPKYQSVDPAKLVPLLVATIKELEARITALETAQININICNKDKTYGNK